MGHLLEKHGSLKNIPLKESGDEEIMEFFQLMAGKGTSKLSRKSRARLATCHPKL